MNSELRRILFFWGAIIALLCLGSCQDRDNSQGTAEPKDTLSSPVGVSPKDTLLSPVGLSNHVDTVRSLLHTDGSTVRARFLTPEGFQRVQPLTNSFQHYLQNLPLKPHGAVVRYYNGELKATPSVYVAVVDMDVGKKDLQQCADAIIRLRAEHLYEQQSYRKIHFNFTNGFEASYVRWAAGYRIRVDGNRAYWHKEEKPSTTYPSFRQFLEQVFMYAGTQSLSQELQSADIAGVRIGDVFIQGGNPGHAVIVVDIAVDEQTQERVFLLAQSYMPAQEIHILRNPNDETRSPWYSNQIDGDLITPEWTFKEEDLKRFPD